MNTKPCHFCGGTETVIVHEPPDKTAIKCVNCDARGPAVKVELGNWASEEFAALCWNWDSKRTLIK